MLQTKHRRCDFARLCSGNAHDTDAASSWRGRDGDDGIVKVFPNKVLMIRGTAQLENIDGIAPEYAACANRYFDPELAQKWLSQLRGMISSQVRITITPEWVGLLDFQTRFPSALAS